MGIDFQLVVAILFRLIKKYEKELKVGVSYILAEFLQEMGEYILQYTEEEVKDLRKDD